MSTQSDQNRSPVSTVQKYMLLILRTAIGWHFLYEGITKLFTPHWSSAGYLEVSRWLFADVFHWIAVHGQVLHVVDWMNILGLIFIGLGLILGFMTRWASIAGMLLLALYYVANPPFVGLDFGVPTEGNYLIVDKNLVEFLALGVLALFPGGTLWGLDSLLRKRPASGKSAAALVPDDKKTTQETHKKIDVTRRDIIKSLVGLPFLGVFGIALAKKKSWESYEEKNLVDAMTSASVKTFDYASLQDLKGEMLYGTIKGARFSRLILGGNLLSGWAHSRDLIYVSQLVKAYHHKDKIFATLLLAEKCGINTLLTNPILCTIINEYWRRDIGKIQFISDCVGLNYGATGQPSAAPYEDFIARIKKSIDHGAIGCYIQGETADYYMSQGNSDAIAKAIDLIRSNNILAGIGAHNIETIQKCVEVGFEPDFWMKTLHHKNYWSARHPEWHDNIFCNKPEETIAFMKSVKQPWIAFKVMAAGAIEPQDGFRFAYENGADFICAGIYDFQMVNDVNIALNILKNTTDRPRPWMA
jgi:uncharacterized membrane protein YphA (DoxX/SURF4 family)